MTSPTYIPPIDEKESSRFGWEVYALGDGYFQIGSCVCEAILTRDVRTYNWIANGYNLMIPSLGSHIEREPVLVFRHIHGRDWR